MGVVQVGEWEPLGLSGEEIGEIQAVAVNPCNPRVIYAGDRLPGHLFKSIDGGASWDTLFAGPVFDIGIDPYHPDTVYALAAGVRKSTDGGSTWKMVFEERGRYEHVSVLELGLQDPETLYLATVESLEGNLYKSTDGGRNWKELGKEVSGLTDISSLVG